MDEDYKAKVMSLFWRALFVCIFVSIGLGFGMFLQYLFSLNN